METAIFIFALIGAVILIALLLAGAAYFYGKKTEENEIAEANLEAAKRAKETAEAIINHKRGDGIDKLKQLRDKANNK